jgi:hypothetical protein
MDVSGIPEEFTRLFRRLFATLCWPASGSDKQQGDFGNFPAECRTPQ